MEKSALPSLDKIAAKTRRMIGTGFALAILLISFISLFGLLRLQQAHDATRSIIDNEQVSVEMLFHMQQAARDRVILLYRLTTTAGALERKELLHQHQVLGEKFGELRHQMSSLSLVPAEKMLLEQLGLATAQNDSAQQKAIELIQRGDVVEAQRLLNQQALHAQGNVLAIINAFLEYEIIEARAQAQLSRERRRETNTLLLVSAIVGLVLIGLIARWLYRRMTTLIDDLSGSYQELTALKLAVDYHDIVSIADVHGRIIYANDKFCEISQYSREELIGQNHRLLKSGKHPDSVYEDMWATISSGKVWQGEVCNRKKGGDYYWVKTTIMPLLDEHSLPFQYISMRTEITQIKEAQQVLKRSHDELEALVEARTATLKEREEMLQQLATTDALTGIFNRRHFNDLLETEIARHQRYQTPFSLILFDIDHFKQVNDTYGHQTGDEVLKQLSALVSDGIRTTDVLARWGGEEFTIITTACDLGCASQLAEKLRLAIVQLDISEVGHITCSFGVTEFHPGDNQDALMKRADQCLYEAKEGGRNRVVST